MSKVGEIERKTQTRIIQLLQNKFGYEYLGNWHARDNNSNIEESLLRQHLEKQKYSEGLINKALYELNKIAGDQNKSLYEINKAIYEDLLRYGVKVKEDIGENTQTVWLIDWENPLNNQFAIAEEVTVSGENDKRPDVVIYVNGIALAVLELKRSTISVAEGIRQNLTNQNKNFIQFFFNTIQLVMAGNNTEGLRYGVIETTEKYYLSWKEETGTNDESQNILDQHIAQICEKIRFLELIHDFIVFDAGKKRICRHNQYFGVKAAQEHIRKHEGGIIWHTQGSGKSLTMIWLAKWIRENMTDARVLIITDRDELDGQIATFFLGVNENIYRCKSGQDLIENLNQATPPLFCSLIHKFGKKDESDYEEYLDVVEPRNRS